MIRPFCRLIAFASLGRRARVDSYSVIADLLDAGLPLESALGITRNVARSQGQGLRAWIIDRWRRALLRDRFANELSLWVPSVESMILKAYGRIEADALFAAAARVAELRERQAIAVRKAVGMPLALMAGLLVLLWAAGGHFIPVLETVVPAERWSPAAALFRQVSTALHEDALIWSAVFVAVLATLALVTVCWTGPGRTLLDRIAPFSLYRTVTGSAFLFVILEFLSAGIDLNDRMFDDLKRHCGPYARHRIGTIQKFMARGAGLGQSMILAGHDFPDPALVPVVAALEDVPGWERKLARFVNRWIDRSEETLRTRAALLNACLLILVTGVMAAAIDAMFSILKQTAVF